MSTTPNQIAGANAGQPFGLVLGVRVSRHLVSGVAQLRRSATVDVSAMNDTSHGFAHPKARRRGETVDWQNDGWQNHFATHDSATELSAGVRHEARRHV